MKIKYVCILSTLLLLITFISFEVYITSMKYNACDLLQVNDTYKNIEKELKEGKISEIEKKYSCQIIMKDNEGYLNGVYQALRNGNIMIDYMEGDRLLG